MKRVCRLKRASPADIYSQPCKAKRGQKLYEGSIITRLIALTYVGRLYPNRNEKPTIGAGRSIPLLSQRHATGIVPLLVLPVFLHERQRER